MSAWIVILACAAYAGLLFGVAWLGDRNDRLGPAFARHAPSLYALALAVYCTSWTFYGAVGTAHRAGWDYLPIYLGPALVFIFAPGVVARIVAIAKRYNIATLSDFLAARYGRSRSLAAATTVLLATGALPYIALQLKSVGSTFEALTTSRFALHAIGDVERQGGVLAATIVLTGFAVLFGARTPDTSAPNRGLVLALAAESVVKFVALFAVAALALGLGASSETGLSGLDRAVFDLGPPSLDFVTLTVLSMAAILCLPRQYHVTVVEAPNDAVAPALRRARWLFPAYLAGTCLVVVPIARTGAAHLPASVDPDLYVIALPAAHGADAIALLAFLGGVSAATGMVVVAAIALSTMITQDLILPATMKLSPRRADRALAGRRLLVMRRLVICALMILAYLYWRAAGASNALAQIGLVSFVAAAQTAPALIGGLFWRSGHRDGAIAGLIGGGLVWAYALILPAAAGAERIAAWGLATALGGALDPSALLGLTGLDPITHAAWMSLSVNVALYVGFSLRARERLIDRVQAAAFTLDPLQPAPDIQTGEAGANALVSVADLRSLAERFLSPDAVARAFDGFAAELGQTLSPGDRASWPLVQRVERLLAGAVGSSTARIVLGSALSNESVAFADVLSVLDETQDERRFKRHLLQATLENLRQGVSVVDKDLRLVAWNGVYLELFRFPPGYIRVGLAVEDVIRRNAEAGELGPGDIEEQVARRLAFYRAGGPHMFERVNRDGRVLRIDGAPMPGGGYVTTFTDVTAERRAEQALREANEQLEHRVEARTKDLAAMAEERDRARVAAERSEATKTRFLAAASHDLQQPLNAARLFAGAIDARLGASDPQAAALARKIDRSIASADAILRGLLDLSRFEADGLALREETFPASDLIEELAHASEPIAERAGLALRVRATEFAVRTDRSLARSILQNLLSNALRYTERGGVLLAARSRDGGARVSFEVYDTGPGVPLEAQARIFEAFKRLADVDRDGERGAGLGLAIAAQAARLLDTRIELRSVVDRGSRFSFSLPSAAVRADPQPTPPPTAQTPLHGLRVLCLDDEADALDGMAALLSGWGCEVVCTTRAEDVSRLADAGLRVDAALFDLHLDADVDGLSAFDRLTSANAAPRLAALVTAERSDEVRRAAEARGLVVLAKPVDPEVLRRFLMRATAEPV